MRIEFGGLILGKTYAEGLVFGIYEKQTFSKGRFRGARGRLLRSLDRLWQSKKLTCEQFDICGLMLLNSPKIPYSMKW